MTSYRLMMKCTWGDLRVARLSGFGQIVRVTRLSGFGLIAMILARKMNIMIYKIGSLLSYCQDFRIWDNFHLVTLGGLQMTFRFEWNSVFVSTFKCFNFKQRMSFDCVYLFFINSKSSLSTIDGVDHNSKSSPWNWCVVWV